MEVSKMSDVVSNIDSLLRTYIVSVQCEKCSFDEVFNLYKRYFKKYENIDFIKQLGFGGKMFIGDTNVAVSMLNRYRQYIGNKGDDILDNIILRVDTPRYLISTNTYVNNTVITTSKYNAELFMRNFKDVKVVPHPYDDEALQFYKNTEYKDKKNDIIMIGWNDPDDHKGFRRYFTYTLKKHNLNRYTHTIISNEYNVISSLSLSNVINERQFTLPKKLLYYRMATSKWYLSLSHTEGFQLPVLEALATGTPVIYPRCHALEHVGFGIAYKCYKVNRDWYDYDDDELADTIQYAMSIPKEQYEDLRMNAIEYVKRNFSPVNVIKYISNILNSNMR